MSRKYRELALNISVEKAKRSNSITASISDSIYNLVGKMITENIGAVVITEVTTPIGIVTERDVLERVILPEKNMHQTLAGDVMSTPLITIEPDHSIKEALDLMKMKGIRRLVIAKNNSLIGLITERRLLEITCRI